MPALRKNNQEHHPDQPQGGGDFWGKLKKRGKIKRGNFTISCIPGEILNCFKLASKYTTNCKIKFCFSLQIW